MRALVLTILSAVWVSGCSTLSNSPLFQTEPSSYGTFIAARYAASSQATDLSAEFYNDVLQDVGPVTFVSNRAFQSALLAGDFERADEAALMLAADPEEGELARLYLKIAGINGLRGYEAPDLTIAQGTFTRLVNDVVDDWYAVRSRRGLRERIERRIQIPQNAYAPMLVHKALLYEVAGNGELANGAWQAALASDILPDFITIEYGNFLIRQNRLEDAITLYQTRLAEDDADIQVQAALRTARQSRVRPPSFPRPNEGVARSFYAMSQILDDTAPPEFTLLFLRMAQRADQDFQRLPLKVAGTLEVLNLYEEAIDTYASIEGEPFEVTGQVQAAWLEFQLQRTDQALARAEAIRDQTQNPEPQLLIADIYRLTDHCDDAIDIYSSVQESLNSTERRWQAYYYEGVCHQELGDWHSAEARYLQALEIAPDEAMVLNHLGYEWMVRDINFEDGFEMVSQALALKPEIPQIRDSVGWGYYLQGDIDTAISWLEDAVSDAPSDPTINHHLGDAYAEAGRVRLATFQWQRALEYETEPAEIARLERKLDSGIDVMGQNTE